MQKDFPASKNYYLYWKRDAKQKKQILVYILEQCAIDFLSISWDAVFLPKNKLKSTLHWQMHNLTSQKANMTKKQNQSLYFSNVKLLVPDWILEKNQETFFSNPYSSYAKLDQLLWSRCDQSLSTMTIPSFFFSDW